MTAFALQPQKEVPNEFVPVEGGTDTTSAESLLVAAYVAMWLLLFGFVWLTHQRQRRLGQKLDHLEQTLKRADSASSADSP